MTRNGTNTSPTHLIGLGDKSADAPVPDGVRHLLIEGQNTTEQDVTPKALATRVQQDRELVSKKKHKSVLKPSGEKSSESSTDSW